MTAIIAIFPDQHCGFAKVLALALVGVCRQRYPVAVQLVDPHLLPLLATGLRCSTQANFDKRFPIVT